MQKMGTICAILILFGPHLFAQTTIFPYFRAGEELHDIVRFRYTFRVVENTSPTIKILFGWHRFYGIKPETYLLETNHYSDGIRYSDPVCTHWPLQGECRPTEASLRVAVPDYNLSGKTGAKTFDPVLFPRQTYEIDGIAGLWKTDMISQMDILGKVCKVEIGRADLVTDKTGWKCAGSLDSDLYREWHVFINLDGIQYNILFALPDSNARYFTGYEIASFGTEFFHTSGLFKIHLWDLEIRQENAEAWLPLRDWKVIIQAGPVDEYGVRIVAAGGRQVMEFSNDAPGPFLEKDAVFSIAPLDGIADDPLNGPGPGFTLRQNFPNPFNTETFIRFDMDRPGRATLKVYDSSGRELAVLFSGDLPAGSHRAVWDASGFPSGIYICRITAGGGSETRKMVLIK